MNAEPLTKRGPSAAELAWRKQLPTLPITHGQYKSREYQAWLNMRGRCNNPNHPSFDYYGGRGITICERWDSFANFIADMGPRPPETELERKNNSGGYSPENCCWATRTEQVSNTRRTIRVSLIGETKCLKSWCYELGQDYGLARNRIVKLGWSAIRALMEPPDQKFNRFKNHARRND